MRIITYADPFSLQNDQELWDLMTKYPHYCASDTLVQGLVKHYGRENFSLIRPLQDLIDVYMKDYSDNPINDMQLYLTVTNCIHNWEDGSMKQAFLFNKSKVVEAVRLLLPLEIDPDKINVEMLSPEQEKLLEIYRIVSKSDCCTALWNLRKKTDIDFEEDVRRTAAREIRHMARGNEEIGELLIAEGINPRMREWPVGIAMKAAQIMIEYYTAKGFKDRVSDVTAALKACRLNSNRKYYKTIVINGIHRFTSEIIYLIRDLENKKHVEIVFLIPYADQLPAVYDTWKKVYGWTELDFEHVKSLGEARHVDAIHMADVLSGRYTKKDKDKKLYEYDNLTSFALHEVGRVYDEAKNAAQNEPEGRENRLNKMKTQFYAVRSQSCNELLKMFYPEQFESKPFLSYPIGQLILGIYRMWDFENSALKLNVDTLMECAVSGLFQGTQNVCDVLRKMKLFFRGADTQLEYKQRIATIRDFRLKAAGDERLSGLFHLSFLNVSDEELLALEVFIDHLCSTAGMLFKGETSDQVNYIDHFNKLMNMITDAANNDSRLLPDVERDLISAIRDQLNTSARTSVNGSLEDVADALAFFLSSKLDNDSSNWIVRDFEQIDGAVLLSKHSQAEEYHFAMLSNEHMLKQNQEDLPWPLTVKMFDAYEEVSNDLSAISCSVRERRNFLKFSLFYGTYFSEKALRFSFIHEEGDEEQTPYYLFSAMGYEPQIVDQLDEKDTGVKEDALSSGNVVFFPQDLESKELFSVCPFKYLMHKVIGADINYYSEYHIYLFMKYYLTYIAKDPKYHRKNAWASVRAVTEDIKEVFPFLGATNFEDWISDAGKNLNDYPQTYDAVHRRKMNFLLAKWDDKKDDWSLNFSLHNVQQVMQGYMSDSVIYPDIELLPKHTICDHCNYVGICLRDFYIDHSIETDEMVEDV